MNYIDLFSGIGGFNLGLQMAGFEFGWVGYSEIDEYAIKVYQKNFPDAENLGDITQIDGTKYRGQIDLITGGFPCQDISTAGKGAGIHGSRSGLWKEMFRLICEIRPRYIVVENVPALLGRGLGVVLGDLSSGGYDAEWDCIPASAVSAPHKRDRIWIIAYPEQSRTRMEKYRGSGQKRQSSKSPESEILRQKNRAACSEGVGTSCKNVSYPHKFNDDVCGFRAGEVSQQQEARVSGCEDNVADTNNTTTSRQRKNGRQILSKSKPERFDMGGENVANTERNQDDRQCEELRRPRGLEGQSLEAGKETIRPQNGTASNHNITRLCKGLKVCDTPMSGFPDWAGGTIQQPCPLTQFERPDGREVEYDFCNVAHGISCRVAKLKCLGNAVVPQVVAWIGFRLKQIMDAERVGWLENRTDSGILQS